jgi:hypothetical protein
MQAKEGRARVRSMSDLGGGSLRPRERKPQECGP